MTDSTDERRNDGADASGTTDVGDRVPTGESWELRFQAPFDDGERHDLTSAIILAVAEAEDASPLEIKEPPLYEVVDVAALEAAFFGSSTIGRSSDGQRAVEFMYRGHRVVVRSDAWVQVYGPVES